MTSLGYRREIRPSTLPVVSRPTVTAPVPVTAWWHKFLNVPKGFLPVVVNSGMSLALSLVLMFGNIVYTSDAVRAILIGASIGTPFALAFANDVAVWFNIVLFFAIGVQSKLIQHTLEFSRQDTLGDFEVFLCIAASTLIIATLVCLLFVSQRRILVTVLSMASVTISTITSLYVIPDMLPLIFITSNSLLLMVLFCTYCCKGQTVAILSLLHETVHDRKWLTCMPLE